CTNRLRDDEPSGPSSSSRRRRDALLLLGFVVGGAAPATHAHAASLLDERPPSSPAAAVADASCASSRLSGELAAALSGALYSALLELGLAEDRDLQREIFKLRDREYRYYYEANTDKLPRVPDLSDMSGGMSNRTYFNFNFYVLWKVAARHAVGADARTALCSAFGRQLLPRVWAGADAAAVATARAGPGGRASQAATLGLLTTLLDALKEGGYICSYQVVWGEAPGAWPGDWFVSQDRITGEAASAGADARGTVFQLKLHQPADIAGSIALRAEEDGFWSRAVSSMAVALMGKAGYGRAVVDEYFVQDTWQGPPSLAARVLLALGDPLEMVDVPFVPSTLVQDWVLEA
ncbi:hypothetical protein FOA52_000433, partial [Chlamydomonas sp. UWO 241]